MKKKTVMDILGILAYIFILSIGFIVGMGYQHQKDEKVINSMIVANDYFVDSSYKFLNGHRLSIPEEISTLTHYDDQEFDLLGAFIDDGADIYLGFTGKFISRKDFLKDSLNLDDSIDMIEEHSEIPAKPIKINKSKGDYNYYIPASQTRDEFLERQKRKWSNP